MRVSEAELQIRAKLIGLYRRMADVTLPKCKACRVPLSCCSPEYCTGTIEHARERWGVELLTTNHPRLPLMGPTGCTAEPHLRPCCAVHTCSINSLGLERNDPKWTEDYFTLREEIEVQEFNLDEIIAITKTIV